MKIAFSTLGCPGWSWDEIFATAKDMGLDGIEIRGVGNEMFAPKIKAYRTHQRTSGESRDDHSDADFRGVSRADWGG